MQNDRQHLADTVLQAREALGYRSRKAFAEAARVSLRSLDSLERAEHVGRKTQARVEAALGWEPGSVTNVLAGGTPTFKQRGTAHGHELRDEVEQEIWSITDLDEDLRWVYIHKRRSRLAQEGLDIPQARNAT